jgi:protein required for attachment to host cells
MIFGRMKICAASGADRSSNAESPTMPKHNRRWFIVADGEHARIVAAAEDGALHTLDRLDSATAHLRSSDLGTDRLGRVHESASPVQHGVEPRTDPHEAAKQRFAKHVGRLLDQASTRDDFDELVLIAPSHILTELRDSLDNPTKRKLLGELGKDLTNTPDHELQPHLKEWARPTRRV